MKPVKILLAIALLFSTFNLKADNNISTWLPTTWGGMNQNQASITDPLIEITPKGIYAEVSMTFTINAQYSKYTNADSIEAILNFDLPPNSYIHDSWLWLDSVTIIRAEVMERFAATTIYNNLVTKIRRDPSLLLKNGNNYKLNVWPVKINYPRKVKIVYSTPFLWNQNTFSIPLPLDIFKASKIQPDIQINVYRDGIYSAPAFMEAQYSSMIQNSSFSQDNLLLTATTYTNLQELNLAYQTSTNGLFLSLFPTGNDEGIYQLAINPNLIPGNTYMPRNITVILDHSENPKSVKTIDAVKQSLSSFLLKSYTDQDSFNIFYVNNTVKQTSGGWQAINAANINAALNSIQFDYNFVPSRFEQLLSNGLSFSKTKPADNSYAIIISNNEKYYDSVTTKPYLVTLKNNLGGSYTHRIYTINNSLERQKNSLRYGSEYLLKDLSQNSGGNYFTSTTAFYINSQTYSLALQNIFQNIAWANAYKTNSYNVEIPITGFTYAGYTINGSNKFNSNESYFETGKYYGVISTGTNVKVEYMAPSGLITLQPAINLIHGGDDNCLKTWVNKYLTDLIGQQNSYYKKEIVDSSINNRVLCDSTAFLALDNGDTIIFGDNVNLSVEEKQKKTDVLKAYPNPFTDHVIIELGKDAEEVTITDVMGRVIYSRRIDKGEKLLVWNGKDSNGNTLPAGMYIVTVKTATDKTMIKILKQ